MTEPIIEAKGVTKVLGSGAARVEAIKGVELSLSGGTLTVLMGPSGSGKTTLLSILGCMLEPTAGTVRICGEAVNGSGPETLAAIRRQYIGFVFQSYHLFPTLSAVANVQLALDIRGECGRRARLKARDVLARVGLAQKVDALPRELSGGEQQRVAIARAIVAEPSALLADEPTGALDAGNGRAVMAILAEIAKDRDRAILVVTHDSRLLTFADRVLNIEDGVITSDHDAAARLYRMRSKA